jgi:uncharacterized membrane protein YeaQ/YmgE (transglycosylase-associated protein family)
MTLDQLVTWIVVGGIAGLIAGAVVKGIHTGLVGAVVVGYWELSSGDGFSDS